MALPKPPIKNMTDFVVFCFVTLVVLTFFIVLIATIFDIIANPERDRSRIINILADTMTTLIGALIGFVAGKGSGRAEVHEEQLKRDD